MEETEEFLSRQLDDLSRQSEERIFWFTGKDGAQKAWDVSEAPESYIGLLKKGIIGIEIDVTSIAGKFKMSQESKEGDREGVIEGFRAMGTEVGEVIARTVEERGRLKV